MDVIDDDTTRRVAELLRENASTTRIVTECGVDIDTVFTVRELAGIHREPTRFQTIPPECPPTWARAFRILAERLREIGDTEGYEMARQIAKMKDVML